MRDPDAVMWGDWSDFPAQRWYVLRRDPALVSRMTFAPDADPELLRSQLATRRVLLMSIDEATACAMLTTINVPCNGRLQKVADSGFFKGYRIRPTSATR